jgi:putative oxidoreductase
VFFLAQNGHNPFKSSRKERVMAYGILFLRVVVGAVLFAHGSQKLFGWWGGGGVRATAGFFGALGFRPPTAMAVMAGVSEAAGLLFAAGFLTPFAALLMASTMVVAIGSVHLKNGLFATNGGYEFNLVLWAVAVAVAATGPGRFSVDHALGWADNLSGLWWGVGVLALSLVGGALVLATREAQPEPDDAEAPLSRESEPTRSAV